MDTSGFLKHLRINTGYVVNLINVFLGWLQSVRKNVKWKVVRRNKCQNGKKSQNENK